ncbi:UNVERIFIED_CONTAM: hypothetical protein HHA_310260 [Hammondia hammondi]|eukprot:XP_008886554.1 hypothetical protein HHA_310260 [Hammondia hammondi]
MFSRVSIVITMWLNNRARNFKHNSSSTPLPKRPPEARLLSPVDELSEDDEVNAFDELYGVCLGKRLKVLYPPAVIEAQAETPEPCVGTRRDDVGVNERTGARDSELKSEKTEAGFQAAAETATVVAGATIAGLSRGPKLNTEISDAVDVAAGTAAGTATGVDPRRCRAGKIGKNVNGWPKASATSESEFLLSKPTLQQETSIGKRVTRGDPGESETKRTPSPSAGDAGGGQVVWFALPQEGFLMRSESSSEGANNLRPTIAVESPSKRGLGPHEGHERCKGIEREASGLSSIKDGPDQEETTHRHCEKQPRREPQCREEATAGRDLPQSKGIKQSVGGLKADSVLDETDKDLVALAVPEGKSIKRMTEKVEVRTEPGGTRQGSPAPHLQISCDNTIDVIASPAKQHIKSAEGSIREIFHGDTTIAEYSRNISGEEWSRALESKLIDTLYSESLP